MKKRIHIKVSKVTSSGKESVYDLRILSNSLAGIQWKLKNFGSFGLEHCSSLFNGVEPSRLFTVVDARSAERKKSGVRHLSSSAGWHIKPLSCSIYTRQQENIFRQHQEPR